MTALASMAMKLALLPCLALAGCASMDNYWQTDLPNYRPSMILITEVENIAQACGSQPATPAACVRRYPTFAHVFIRPGLPREQYECTMSHEILGHVIRGMGHDERRTYSLDCGPPIISANSSSGAPRLPAIPTPQAAR